MMSFPRILLLVTALLFGTIGMAAWLKKDKAGPNHGVTASGPVEVPLDGMSQIAGGSSDSGEARVTYDVPRSAEGLPDGAHIEEFFNRGIPQLSIVETITYTSKVGWMQGRPAWLADYAAHYKTSRHFIARSLNDKADYLSQDVTNGDKFNVFREDKDFSFYLLVDASRCKMWFYYHDHDTDERVLLKRYEVGLGRADDGKASGTLTPLGKYTLGDKIATYRPQMMGYHLGQRIEMITVFGTRWIPFDTELGNCTAPAKGFGIHGCPWERDYDSGSLAEAIFSLGQYYSDGCIRMATDDVEELFAIIITKPTVIEIVEDFHDARLPGKEAIL